MNSFTKSLAILGFFVAAIATVRGNSSVDYTYDRYGNRTSITTRAGDTARTILEQTTFTYDTYRRCISKTEGAQDQNSQRIWTWTYERYFDDYPNAYDPGAHTSKQWRLQYEPAYDVAGHRNVTARWFDANDRIVDEYTGVIDTPGPGGGLSNGPDIEVHHSSYDENGQKKTYTDPLGRLTTYNYDDRNRLRDTIEPLNRITTTDYDFAGNKTAVTFPDTKTQQWLDYDAFGQPGRFIDERNDTTNLIYCWGPMKKLYKVTTHRDKDGGGTEDQLTTFSYDLMGKPTKVEFPDPDHTTEVSTYRYGQLETFKTRKGQLKTIDYDVRGRETYASFANNAAPAITRSWDDANRARSLCNIYSTITYDYDDAGRVKTEINSVTGSGGPAVTTYERYPNGSVSRIVYPENSSIRRDYNSRGQLSATGSSNASNNWSVQYATYHYLGDGKLDYQDYVNGVHTAFGYDPRGFLNHLTVTRNGQTYAERTYYRDDRDRISAFQKGSNSSANPMEDGRGDHYWYDAEGQLTDAYYGAVDPVNNPHGPIRSDSFAYDALGNRKGWNYVANKGWMSFLRRDNGLNQYTSWENNDPNPPGHWGTAMSYDDNSPWAPHTAPPGNGVMMAEGNLVASYNALNQPVAMIPTGSPNIYWFGFDPLGRCVKRVVGPSIESGTATYFYYDGWSLIQEGPSATAIDRIYMLGNRVDEIVADYAVANGQWMFHHSEGRGHNMLLTAANGTLAEQNEYDAFGGPYFFNAAGQPQTASNYGNRFLFTGREWLSELKLYDYRNRMYQPELGRFMQPDPKEFEAGDYNLYRYCHNDPVNNSDATGLDLTINGGGDWKWFNGSVAFAQLSLQKSKDNSNNRSDPYGADGYTPSTSPTANRMVPNVEKGKTAATPVSTTHSNATYQHQFKTFDGKRISGRGYTVLEHLRHIKGTQAGDKQLTERPLQSNGIFTDRVGLDTRPSRGGTTVSESYQTFEVKHNGQPVDVSTVLKQHTTEKANGDIEVIVTTVRP